MDIVLDASVVIKWFKDKDEDFVSSALDIQKKKMAGDVNIIVPGLLFLEVLNAFLTKKDFTRGDMIDIKECLVKMNMDIVYPESELLEETISIAEKNKLTFYDALYIATA